MTRPVFHKGITKFILNFVVVVKTRSCTQIITRKLNKIIETAFINLKVDGLKYVANEIIILYSRKWNYCQYETFPKQNSTTYLMLSVYIVGITFMCSWQWRKYGKLNSQIFNAGFTKMGLWSAFYYLLT